MYTVQGTGYRVHYTLCIVHCTLYIVQQTTKDKILMTIWNSFKERLWVSENWFQYVRRVYATAINFPCIITLAETTFCLHCSLQPAVQMFFCKQMTLGLLLRVSAKMFKNPRKLISLQNLQNSISLGWIFGPLHVFISSLGCKYSIL